VARHGQSETSGRVTSVDWDRRFANENQKRSQWQASDFHFGKDPTSPPHTVTNPVHPVMVMEGRADGGTALDQCPGFGLSISELCHALKAKLAQTRDSRYAYITA